MTADLFGPAPRASPPRAPEFPDLGPEWAKVRRAAGPVPIEIVCMTLWTGVALEVVTRRGLGTHMVGRDLRVRQLSALADEGPDVRKIFMTPRQVRELAAATPVRLVRSWPTGIVLALAERNPTEKEASQIAEKLALIEAARRDLWGAERA